MNYQRVLLALLITWGTIPSASNACSSKRSKLVVMITLIYPFTTNLAIALWAVVGIFNPSFIRLHRHC